MSVPERASVTAKRASALWDQAERRWYAPHPGVAALPGTLSDAPGLRGLPVVVADAVAPVAVAGPGRLSPSREPDPGRLCAKRLRVCSSVG